MIWCLIACHPTTGCHVALALSDTTRAWANLRLMMQKVAHPLVGGSSYNTYIHNSYRPPPSTAVHRHQPPPHHHLRPRLDKNAVTGTSPAFQLRCLPLRCRQDAPSTTICRGPQFSPGRLIRRRMHLAIQRQRAVLETRVPELRRFCCCRLIFPIIPIVLDTADKDLLNGARESFKPSQKPSGLYAIWKLQDVNVCRLI
ncbi:calcium-dependent ARF-type GTPase activating protein family [Striga asiatica]|uniref:Calcium-dependent ARF-type GTPase activating protein family n=1 Tax=Striga asiatica TaxID=4170 RepID=A0A5A7QM58_STRAF|nr:calcium-dependent ARF-type GTPase activating protein family [Striga asiatica]